mgnify:CR=1 FL=1
MPWAPFIIRLRSRQEAVLIITVIILVIVLIIVVFIVIIVVEKALVIFPKILRCTEKSPDRRYANVSDLTADLKQSLVTPDVNFVKQHILNLRLIVILRLLSLTKAKDLRYNEDDNNKIAEGTVISITPKAGGKTSKGSVIRMIVSKGPKEDETVLPTFTVLPFPGE